MHISIILGHPNPGSFNHALASTAAEELRHLGHTVTLHDLYAESFDPLTPTAELARDAALPPMIARHCREIATAEGIVIVHPNWWGQPPAMLKGWIDRVLRQEVAYRFVAGDKGEGVPLGLLRAKTALVLNTSNTPAARELEAFGDPLERLWRDCVFRFCGVPNFVRRTFSVVIVSTPEQRADWLRQTRQLVRDAFPRG